MGFPFRFGMSSLMDQTWRRENKPPHCLTLDSLLKKWIQDNQIVGEETGSTAAANAYAGPSSDSENVLCRSAGEKTSSRSSLAFLFTSLPVYFKTQTIMERRKSRGKKGFDCSSGSPYQLYNEHAGGVFLLVQTLKEYDYGSDRGWAYLLCDCVSGLLVNWSCSCVLM